MNQLNSINTISALIGRFVIQVKALNSISQFGINYLSETVLIPVLNEIYSYDLENLNTTSNNFPGIDLGDKKARVAFQITSNADSGKVKETLEKCIKYEHYKIFDKVFIYCLTEKVDISKNYSEVIDNKFQFDKASILDYRDLLKAINSITDYDKILRIETLLRKQFSEIRLEQLHQYQTPVYETVCSNLLKINLPKKLYTARIAIDKNDLNKKRRIFNDRELIFAYKKENELSFSADWVDHNKQLYSFHDLSNSHHAISKIIDLGTVETITPNEFYSQSKDHERVFKALLKYCLSKYVFFLGIDFMHAENLYVFKSEDETKVVRSESWNSGRRNATRDVIRIKINKRTNDVWYYTHLAFSVVFKLYNGDWFLEITPDWYVTKDGQNKHFTKDREVTSWLKRNERNQHVFNNTKFIANYLKYGKSQSNLFESAEIRRPKNFLELMNFESFKNVPRLNEDAWKIKESDEAIKMMEDSEGTVDTEL